MNRGGSGCASAARTSAFVASTLTFLASRGIPVQRRRDDGGEVDDHRRRHLGYEALDRRVIRQVRPSRRDTVGQRLGLLAVGRGVEIGDHNTATGGGQPFDGFRPHKPEPASDKNRVRHPSPSDGNDILN